ncbi:unnamed protein product [Effrenium voratum]|uniref:FAD-binding domain-containing protein n=1 Tax=Effrenium voratum TaxID=2562239 RepID=A0AA36HN69_9DINO|nr:unnamed protein product [Effrenium voratum]CAJ1452044.1 unnamed protein product [Effrenium voratum]
MCAMAAIAPVSSPLLREQSGRLTRTPGSGRATGSAFCPLRVAAAFCGLPLARGWRVKGRTRTRVTRAAEGARVAVVGAGPAGLAAALALRKEGLEDVTVFERAPKLRPGVGGGVQLHAGAALLAELGVNLGFAQPLRRIRSRGVDGSELLRLDLPQLVDRFAPLTGSIRRPDGDLASCTVMRDALLAALAAQLPPGSVKFGKELQGLELKSGSVTANFSGESEDFDLVIAADGIGSLARSVVTETVEKPRYTGLRIQYGVREAGGRPAGCEEEAHQWFGEGVYALTATYGGLGSKRYEMLAAVFREDAPAAENADWEPVQVQESCLRRLRASGHVPEVLDMASGCSRFFELGVCERPIGFNRWHRGRLVLIGDSAHAMPPFLGQGANQAIQDAVCLARRLAGAGLKSPEALEEALNSFTAARLPPVAVLGLESGFVGQVETLPGAVGSLVRDNFFRVMGGSGMAGLVFLNGAVARV